MTLNQHTSACLVLAVEVSGIGLGDSIPVGCLER